MKIQLDEKVRKYLNEKGKKVLTVDLNVGDSCCVPASIPHVVLGEPKIPQRYNQFRVDDIDIYVYKGAVVKRALRLILRNYILFKEVEVEGIQLI